MKELMLALMTWAASYTGLPPSTEVPLIEKSTRCEMTQLAFDLPEDIPCEIGKDDPGPIAVYNHDTKTIHLVEDWSPTKPIDVATLLHELVHHLQNEAGLMDPWSACPGADYEAPAYKTHLAWLDASGLDGMKESGMNHFLLLSITSCPGG